MDDQRQTPFVAELERVMRRAGVSFHMPGHKQKEWSVELGELWRWGPFGADLSEMGGIDYLHAPRGALRDAQTLAAAAFGADHSFFLVNGSTAGNLASVLLAAGEGDTVVLPRASHRSVYAALLFASADALFLPPVADATTGLPLAVDCAEAQLVIGAATNVRAIHVTSPSYYGLCLDLTACAGWAGTCDAALLVDEAHGGHFGFHPALPPSALACGADLVVQSTHKTLGSLTGSSMLHVRGQRFSPGRVREMLAHVQSSSPNALMLASLDAARALMATRGQALLDKALELAAHARSALRSIRGINCYGEELIGTGGVSAFDPTKIVAHLSLPVSGFEADLWLRERRGVEAELADLTHLVFSVTHADTADSIERLIAAMRALSDAFRDRTGAANPQGPGLPPVPRRAQGMRQAYWSASEPSPLTTAAGHVCAEFVMSYPPGIPALVPGELVDRATIEYLESVRRLGGRIVGTEDPNFRTIQVLA